MAGINFEVRTPEVNKLLVERYPFLMPRNAWTGKIVEDYDYSYTLFDMIPKGWRSGFGIEFIEKLRNACVEADFLDKLLVTQIKEKYGELRFYTNPIPQNICKIITDYEYLSRYVCIDCGRPAKWVSKNWISPWCDECCKETRAMHPNGFERIETYFGIYKPIGDSEWDMILRT